MPAEPPNQQASRQKRTESVRAKGSDLQQVQVRLVGQSRQAVEAALALLQVTAGVQVQHGPHRGRKNEWLAYGIVSLSPEGAPEEPQEPPKRDSL